MRRFGLFNYFFSRSHGFRKNWKIRVLFSWWRFLSLYSIHDNIDGAHIRPMNFFSWVEPNFFRWSLRFMNKFLDPTVALNYTVSCCHGLILISWKDSLRFPWVHRTWLSSLNQTIFWLLLLVLERIIQLRLWALYRGELVIPQHRFFLFGLRWLDRNSIDVVNVSKLPDILI